MALVTVIHGEFEYLVDEEDLTPVDTTPAPEFGMTPLEIWRKYEHLLYPIDNGDYDDLMDTLNPNPYDNDGARNQYEKFRREFLEDLEEMRRV